MDKLLEYKVFNLVFGILLLYAGIFKNYFIMGFFARYDFFYRTFGIKALRGTCIVAGAVLIISIFL